MLLFLVSCELTKNNCEKVDMIIKEVVEQKFEMFCLLPILVQLMDITKAAGREGTKDAFFGGFYFRNKNSLRSFEELATAKKMLNFLLDEKVATLKNISWNIFYTFNLFYLDLFSTRGFKIVIITSLCAHHRCVF